MNTNEDHTSVLGLEELQKLQTWLFTMMISITVKHYQSGSFSFVVMKHNGDATGWTKISPFMGHSYYNYRDALAGGIEWYYKHKDDEELLRVGIPVDNS